MLAINSDNKWYEEFENWQERESSRVICEESKEIIIRFISEAKTLLNIEYLKQFLAGDEFIHTYYFDEDIIDTIIQKEKEIKEINIELFF